MDWGGQFALACCVTAAVSGASVRAQEPTVLPLVVHTVQLGDQPVAPAEFIEQRVARANQIFAPYGVAFAITQRAALPAKHARLEQREDRDALGAYVKRGAIHCFVVESLRDVDEPERMRRGVHWHSRAFAGAHFVIVSLLGGPDVLAHELGHFLGNPEHSDTPGNLMSYEHGPELPFLDASQRARLSRTLQRYVRSGEIRAVRAARSGPAK